MRRLLLLALVAQLGGCPTPQVGTIELGLATAPGSTLLDAVTRLRVTLTRPLQVVEANRGPDGFDLVLDVEATGESGSIIVEGFDENAQPIAVGQSPEFGIAAINAGIVVYMSVPLGISRAPVSLLPARASVAGDRLSSGVVFAGGRDVATSAPSDAVAFYNAFDHTLVGAKPMPAARDGITVATGAAGIVTLFGGRDAAANPTGTYWLLDTTFAPGAYLEVGDFPGLARADEVALTVAPDTFVISGTPPLDVKNRTVAARTDLAGLARTAATFVTAAGVRTGLTLDATGRLVRFHDMVFEPLAPSRFGGAVAALPDGRFIVVGGGTAEESNDILIVDASGTVSMVSDVLAAPRIDAHVAVTRRHIVITGNPIEILDATTLTPVVTRDALEGLPFALPNDQVLILDATNGELSLFTPPPTGV